MSEEEFKGQMFKGRLYRLSEELIFNGEVIDHDAGEFSMTALRDVESDRAVFGEFLAEYMGKRVVVLIRILAPVEDDKLSKDCPHTNTGTDRQGQRYCLRCGEDVKRENTY